MKKCISYLLLMSICLCVEGAEIPELPVKSVTSNRQLLDFDLSQGEIPEQRTPDIPKDPLFASFSYFPNRLLLDFDLCKGKTPTLMHKYISDNYSPDAVVIFQGTANEMLFPMVEILNTLIDKGGTPKVCYCADKIPTLGAEALARLQTPSLEIRSEFETPQALECFISGLNENRHIKSLTVHISQSEILELLCNGLRNSHLSTLALFFKRE